MNPTKVKRSQVTKFTDLPNVGTRTADDLQLLGYREPADLQGQDPYEMYSRLCVLTNTKMDPCVIDVFISITRFADGHVPKPWWHFTAHEGVKC